MEANKSHLTRKNLTPGGDYEHEQPIDALRLELIPDAWVFEKMANFDTEVFPERRMNAKGSGALEPFPLTYGITKYSKAKIFRDVGKNIEKFNSFFPVPGGRVVSEAERKIRGCAVKFYTGVGIGDVMGNNTPIFFLNEDQSNSNEALLELHGAGYGHNFRCCDEDYFTHSGDLSYIFKDDGKADLIFKNTAAQVGYAEKFIQIRHIRNCYKADPEYGQGVAKALSFTLDG